MGMLRMSDRAWEKQFLKLVEPQIKAGAPVVNAQLRDKTSTAAGTRVAQAAEIMARYGYRLSESYTGKVAMGGGWATAAGGTVTFQKIGTAE